MEKKQIARTICPTRMRQIIPGEKNQLPNLPHSDYLWVLREDSERRI